jgi:hypothetical protein
MSTPEEREKRLQLLEDHIGRSLQESHRNGELASAPSFGKPLDFGDGYEETPAELRMPYKMLKDAGYVPAEVEALKEIARLQQQIDAAPEAEGEGVRALRQRVAELRQHVALRLEKLRISGSL